MSEQRRDRIDQELVKALSHPIRVEILESLQGRIASPSELSRELKASLGVVSYHANTLVRCGCLELVHTEPRRGAVEHFFGITPRSSIGHQDWRQVPPALRGEITGAAVEAFIEVAASALEAGTIDARDDTTLSWMPLTVDDEGWREIAKIMEGASRQVAEAHARSAKRLAGAKGTSIVVGLAAFEAGRPVS
ncbi:MAG TPA: winged helix-turn-helix domain-containing protein [Solirubrobacterales bacterium]|nr:winged helix-turn-helix domain-containing protein [Solirubrobacterales bacterium]